MARWAPQKKDTMEALASEILHNYGHGRAIIAVDGRSGSGMHQFGEDLAAALKGGSHAVFQASIDDFRRPRALRAGGLYTDGYDYSLLRRVLIDPFRTAGSTGFALTGFDADRDEPVFQPKWKSAGADAVLIVDGVFLNRPELSGIWNYSIWLEDPSIEDEFDTAYLTAENPSSRATAIYDNSDPEHPRRIFADSC
jgi:uridine kinase